MSKLAPGIVKPVRLIVLQEGDKLEHVISRAEVALYSVLTGNRAKVINPDKVFNIEPVIDAGSFKQAILLGDVFATDLRLNILLLRRAERLGAVCINR